MIGKCITQSSAYVFCTGSDKKCEVRYRPVSETHSLDRNTEKTYRAECVSSYRASTCLCVRQFHSVTYRTEIERAEPLTTICMSVAFVRFFLPDFAA